MDGTALHDGLVDTRKGWLVAAAAFCANLVVFGITYSFGVLFEAFAAEFGTGRSGTAFVFSLTNSLLFLLGLVTGPAADRYGPRPLLLLGAAIMGAGLLLTSRADSLWAGYLTYGVAIGLGGACTYIPLVAAVGGWFERYRTLAMGLTVAGIGAGSMLVAPIAARLVEQVGFRTTCVVLGMATLVVIPLCALAAQRPARRAELVPLELGRVLRTAEFARLYVSSMGLSVAVFVPFVFLAPFARDHGLSGLQAASLVGLMGGASVVGRLGLAGLGNRWQLLRTYRACFVGLGSSMVVWLLSDGSYLDLAGFAVLFGLAQGGWISLTPAVAARLYGAAGLGRLLGLLYTAGGIGALVGPPLAGATIDLADSYTPALLVSAALAFGALAVFRGVGAEPRRPVAMSFGHAADLRTRSAGPPYRSTMTSRPGPARLVCDG